MHEIQILPDKFHVDLNFNMGKTSQKSFEVFKNEATYKVKVQQISSEMYSWISLKQTTLGP